MVDHQALIRVFADYARTISQRYEIGDVLYRLTDQIVDVLQVDGAGVSVMDREGVLRFVTATDDDVVRVEEEQIQSGEGPCQDAFRTSDTVTSGDLVTEERWPSYRRVAVDAGCMAVAGIPMALGERRVGALNMYNRSRREWQSKELEIAQILGDMATGYIINALTRSESEQLTAQLEHALQSRVIVEQAKGVLAERHGISPAAAFKLLRERSRNSRTRIHDVAQHVVDGDLRL